MLTPSVTPADASPSSFVLCNVPQKLRWRPANCSVYAEASLQTPWEVISDIKWQRWGGRSATGRGRVSYTQKLWTVLKKKAAYLPGC